MTEGFFDIGWEEMALLGSLSQELAEEEKEKRRLEREIDPDECDSCCQEPDPCDPPDPPFYPSEEDP